MLTVAQSVECATSGQGVVDSIPCSVHPHPTGWVGVSIIRPAETKVLVSVLEARKIGRTQSYFEHRVSATNGFGYQSIYIP